MKTDYKLLVNGEQHTVQADAESSLLSVLRDALYLTGAKYGCGEGQCGACTVLIDGKPTRSCRTSVKDVAGWTYHTPYSSTNKPGPHIVTIEGIEQNGKLHPVQTAFLEEDALQCGYCTSGMILSAVALINKNPHPTESQIVSAMQGNLCRCGTYRRIIRAIQSASKQTPTHEGIVR